MPDPISRALGSFSLGWDAQSGGVAHSLVAHLAQEGIFLAVLIVVAGAWLASTGPLPKRVVEAGWRLAPGVVAAAIAFGIAHAAGWLVPEARPFVLLGRPALIAHAADTGFPSDHVIVGMAMLAARVGTGTRVATALVVALVGVARVVSGIHWLDDVVAGAVLGLAIAWLVSTAWASLVAPRLRAA